MKNQKLKVFIGNIFRKILPNIQEFEYGIVCSSRTVIKSVKGESRSNGGYYGSDIWTTVSREIGKKLPEGITLFYEIVGNVNGKSIQKNYDYGCKPDEHKVLIYRITETNRNGNVTEFDWWNIKDFCEMHGFQHVPELYYGQIGNLINHETEDLLQYLKDTYLEKDCQYCAKKVPAEGICIRNESDNKIAYKLKSKAFLAWETKQLDEGEEIVE